MITVEQARDYFPPEERPTDKELERMLAAYYGIATRTWELFASEKSDESR